MNGYGNERNFFDRLSKLCLEILSAVTLVCMLLLMVLGILTMFLGIYKMSKYFVVQVWSGPEAPPVTFALAAALDGLEFVFLAPLAFLLLNGIWNFIDDVRRHNRSNYRGEMPPSPLFLMHIKGLMIGLMVAVVATELLKKAVSERGLSYESAIAGTLLIAVLAFYALVIERSARERSGTSADDLGPKQ